MTTSPPTATAATPPVSVSGGFLRIPTNRVVAWIGPWIALVSAALAAWLSARVNVLGIPGLDKNNLQTYLTAGITFGVVAGLHALGGWKWLTGHHILLQQGKS